MDIIKITEDVLTWRYGYYKDYWRCTDVENGNDCEKIINHCNFLALSYGSDPAIPGRDNVSLLLKWSFDYFFVTSLNILLNRQSSWQWFETPLRHQIAMKM